MNVNTVQPCSVSSLIQQSKEHPLRWLLPEVVLEGAVHVLHGHEESFKTMLTLQLHEALATGKEFLLRQSEGGLRTGIVELESKNNLFGHRLQKFFQQDVPDIRVMPDDLRRELLDRRQPKERIGIIADWAESQELEFVSIDSAVKLFPFGCDLSKPDVASEVFSQIQRLPTVWVIAHDRKPLPGISAKGGNAEIVGSGRFAQDPDVVHQLIRDDRRAPVATFDWGKVRDGEKPAPLELFFDSVDFRLYPLHPYIHLLQRPKLQSELIAEAERRYGWHERRARDYIASLAKLQDVDGNSCIEETTQGHNKRVRLIAKPHPVTDPES